VKEIIALLIFICVATVTIYLSVIKHIDTRLTVILLAFSILGGLAAANFDVIRRFKWKEFEIEAFEHQVTSVKEEALQEMRKQVQEQKDATALLVRDANDTRAKLEAQKSAVESMIRTAKELQKDVETQRESVVALGRETTQARARIEELTKASNELALLLTKITWLQQETKNEFGTNRAQKAMERVTADLNKVIITVIPDPQERNRWIQGLSESLPPRGP
jgi:hypothetical protein